MLIMLAAMHWTGSLAKYKYDPDLLTTIPM
jgi:hypothetical protein